MGWRKTTLTIGDGETESDVLDLTENAIRGVSALAIRAPAHGVTVTVHAEVGGTYAPLQSAGSNIELPASVVTQITEMTVSRIKLVAGSAVSGDQVFAVEGAMRD